MNNLKQMIYYILLNQPECRNSRGLLKYEVLKRKGFVIEGSGGEPCIFMSKSDFIKWETDTVRRCSQNLQRSDLLTGTKLIQPTKEIKQKRVKLSKEKGYSFIQGKQPVFNPITQTYEY